MRGYGGGREPPIQRGGPLAGALLRKPSSPGTGSPVLKIARVSERPARPEALASEAGAPLLAQQPNSVSSGGGAGGVIVQSGTAPGGEKKILVSFGLLMIFFAFL